jgi:hypothetical protein
MRVESETKTQERGHKRYDKNTENTEITLTLDAQEGGVEDEVSGFVEKHVGGWHVAHLALAAGHLR